MTEPTDTASIERFKIMERKLLNGIMTPSMVVAVALGVWLIMFVPEYMSQGWMHAKLTFVVLLLGYHHWCMKIVKTFKNDANTRSHVWYRWFNEAPVVSLIAIVILVIVKPF
jgi:putative membrane protein